MKYLIWSFEHRGWWKPGSHGYTTRTDKAGLYDLAVATDIVTRANEHCKEGEVEEVMVPAPSRDLIALDLEYPDR